jgi:metal-responsive CopG/Arc/MetJ family transcriptional regulator
VAEIDAFMMGRGYANRSEAIRDHAPMCTEQKNS